MALLFCAEHFTVALTGHSGSCVGKTTNKHQWVIISTSIKELTAFCFEAVILYNEFHKFCKVQWNYQMQNHHGCAICIFASMPSQPSFDELIFVMAFLYMMLVKSLNWTSLCIFFCYLQKSIKIVNSTVDVINNRPDNWLHMMKCKLNRFHHIEFSMAAGCLVVQAW